jgi:hypothetical protein
VALLVYAAAALSILVANGTARGGEVGDLPSPIAVFSSAATHSVTIGSLGGNRADLATATQIRLWLVHSNDLEVFKALLKTHRILPNASIERPSIGLHVSLQGVRVVAVARAGKSFALYPEWSVVDIRPASITVVRTDPI